MNVLLVGKGGREHAIAWKLAQSTHLGTLLVAPGNPGTAPIGENVPIDIADIEGLLHLAKKRRIDLTVVGPEAPLAAGIVDRFTEMEYPIFGPTSAAARIESSKIFAKELMLHIGVPTAPAKNFNHYEDAAEHVKSLEPPIVIKADGLAAGKGVIVARSQQEALDALSRQLVESQFGRAGHRVLVEQYMEGREISVFGFVDGRRISTLIAACDYKRAGDGDTGPNTGGMGSYSQPSQNLWNDQMEHEVRTAIMEPVVQGLMDMGNPYKGVLYAGLMITTQGPKVVEFNCRLGDPETQVVLPRLRSDLLEVMQGAAEGNLGDGTLDWDPRSCVGVVIASGGYPNDYGTGYPIDGLEKVNPTVNLFHADTKISENPNGRSRYVTAGGRILTVSALGISRSAAREAAYRQADQIRFTNSYYRRDIAADE